MKFKRLILNTLLALTLLLSAAPAVAGRVYAAAPSAGSCGSSNSAKGQVLNGIGETGSNCNDNQVNDTLQTVVGLLSLVIGIVSVIVIMISGFKYIVSGGESNKVTNAKNSLLYAIVGLAVAALAQLMIHFVLFQTSGT